MSLFKRLKRKGVSDEKNKREGSLTSLPVNVTELRPPSSSADSFSNVKHLTTPNRATNYTLENTTLFEGLNVPGVKASSDKDTDSQGSADTSRSQHTDVTSELSSVVSVPDKTDDTQVNHRDDHYDDDDDDDDDDGVKGSSFSFVRSDSKDEESSGDENQTQFAFIKEDDQANDDLPLESQDHNAKAENNTLPIITQKVQSDEVDYGHSSELQVTPVDHQEPTSDVEKDTNSQNARLNVISTKPPALADSLKTNPDDHAVNSNVPSSFPSIGKVTPTAPVTKSTVAKKKKRAKRPGQTSQWKHEETPLDEIQMAKELHHSVSSSLLEKEPLNDIPEDNEEASTPSEDQILATPELINSHKTVPTIQIQVTCDQLEIKHKASLSTIPEIQVLSDDGSDSDAVFEKGSSDNLSASSETAVPVTSENNTSTPDIKVVPDDSPEKDANKEDLLDNSSPLLDATPQHKPTDYGIELSEEDKITLLVQTSDSKLSDIQASCDELVTNSNRCVSESIGAVTMRIKKRNEYQHLREQEATCLAEENYELAEQLGAKMESLSIELEYKLENTSEEVSKFVTNQLKILEEEKELRNELVEKLNTIKCDEEEKLDKINKEFSFLQMKEKKKLATIEDHINREKGYIGLDKEHVLKAEASYNSEREERCADYLTKKRSLSEEMSTLQEQIAEVEKQLAALRQKEVILLTALSEEDAKVKTVEDEMQGEKQQIDSEWEKIKKRETELQNDINELEVNRSSYQDMEDEHNKTQQGHQLLLETLNGWVTTHCDRLKQLDRSSEALQCCHTKVMPATDRTSTPDLNQMEEEKRTMSQQVKELTAKVFTVQTQMSQIQKTSSDINNRIPQLNEAKKAAVAGRQYREAGQISQQVKTLTKQLEEEQEKMSLLETQLSSHTTQLLSLNQQLANMEAKILSLRKEKDITVLQRIFKQCKQLIDEANSNHSIPGLLDFLKSYSKLCRTLADEICIKYTLELSDLGLVDISIDDNNAEIKVTEEKPSDGNSLLLPSDSNNSTGSHPGPINSSREELEQEITSVESQIDSAVNSEDFELAATLDDRLKSLKETLNHV